jgi:methyl-accepting chemotaxis protein
VNVTATADLPTTELYAGVDLNCMCKDGQTGRCLYCLCDPSVSVYWDVDQINTAVAQMDKVTQQNAANAEESASASEELTAQAESMNGVIQELVALVGGRSSRPQKAGNKGKKASRSGASGQAWKAHETAMKKKGPGLSASDKIFHKIASKTPSPAARDPEQVIPLNKDENFGGFNG